MSSHCICSSAVDFMSARASAIDFRELETVAVIPGRSSYRGIPKIQWSRGRSFSGNIFRVKAGETKADVEESTLSSPRESSSPKDGGSSSGSFLSILCPLLKLFASGDPSEERNEVLEVATSSLSSLARLPWGTKSIVESSGQKNYEDTILPLQLYEFEACPFCRRVREALTELDLTVEVYPCPKGSSRHRPMVLRLGGREQFPFLVDPNTGISMYESDDIVKYLFQRYGGGRSPSPGLLESTLFTGWMPTLLRAGRGMALWNKATSEPPLEKLELFSYENNPSARIVREALCELELPYILRNAGEGSSRILSLFQISGSKQVPFLVDNNTGTKLGGSKAILDYLFDTYRNVQ